MRILGIVVGILIAAASLIRPRLDLLTIAGFSAGVALAWSCWPQIRRARWALEGRESEPDQPS